MQYGGFHLPFKWCADIVWCSRAGHGWGVGEVVGQHVEGGWGGRWEGIEEGGRDRGRSGRERGRMGVAVGGKEKQTKAIELKLIV